MAPKPLDMKDNTLNVESKVAIAPFCIVTVSENGAEEFWHGDNETSILKEVLDQMGDCRIMKKDFASLTYFTCSYTK